MQTSRLSFRTCFEIEQNIMGLTEEEVENEAKRLLLGGSTKHDSIYGAKHLLENPSIRKLCVCMNLLGNKENYFTAN